MQVAVPALLADGIASRLGERAEPFAISGRRGGGSTRLAIRMPMSESILGRAQARMPVLLVDDRDGRVVAELMTDDDVRGVLEAWGAEDGTLPDYLCLVEMKAHHGALLGTDSSVKIRPL